MAAPVSRPFPPFRPRFRLSGPLCYRVLLCYLVLLCYRVLLGYSHQYLQLIINVSRLQY